ncbi:hypothetical protein N7468_006042 [Penicillium chermesinum]|uniref:Uncharacterized protein n=1 Tax=Penicillium chermesinum TaxID=63820 RepID=A0A9W9P0A4_9EURO|nr:uncharacterized protein N7468_006042 [Penicillium chermesinum]KAJ5233086.1 hypothetical protein N7468_006042 [Penicillium chermesinum]KAJ6172720.1 hypothetical protein N7470_001787 [Penicillium chermesinum]
MASPEVAMLEALVPGYAFFSRFVLSYLHIDLGAYLQHLMLLALFGVSVKYVTKYVSDFVMEYLVSTAEIRLDDEIFNYFMYWISRQPHMKQTNRFVVGLKSNGYWSDSEDSDDEDNFDADYEVDEPGSSSTADSFDDYWAKVIRRDKYKPLRITPAEGRHYIWYQGRPLVIQRRYESSSASRYVLHNERLYISCLGRDPSIIRSVLNEAQNAYVQRDGVRTIIHRGMRPYSGASYQWCRCMARSPRPMSTVVLDQTQKDAFIKDVKEYLHPRTRRWYSNRGIPYRRGYLLHGPPGTGKTSLCFAAAGLLGLKLYLLNLNSKALDEDGLSTLFSELPKRCIVLLEDVDTAGITQTRGKTIVEGSALTSFPVEEDALDEKGPQDPQTGGVTLSGLLNVIDGVAASEGRILVMTSNHPEKLDAALVRPGRVDMTIAFGYTSEAAIEELFTSIYMTMDGDLPRKAPASSRAPTEEKEAHDPTLDRHREQDAKMEMALHDRIQTVQSRIPDLAKEFAASIPKHEFTAAEIQGYLLNHKTTPEEAIKGADEWVRETRAKKRAREETQQNNA